MTGETHQPSVSEPSLPAGDDTAGKPEIPGSGTPEKKKRKPRSAWRETVSTIAWALVIALVIKTFLIQAFYIPSESMRPTLQVGDRILVNKLVPNPLGVSRGDVVVFVDPGGWLDAISKPKQSPVGKIVTDVLTFVGLLPANSGEHLIKRVIGLAGDKVECCGPTGKIKVNGVEITEPYLADPSWYAKSSRPQDTFSIVVPDQSVWVMGDNRSNSLDSRYHLNDTNHGAVPLRHVVGVAQVITWPLDRLRIMRNPGETFSQVP